jgi:hypothetical protein
MKTNLPGLEDLEGLIGQNTIGVNDIIVLIMDICKGNQFY